MFRPPSLTLRRAGAVSLVLLCLAAAPAFAQDAGGLLESLSGALSDAAPGTDARATLSGRILQFIALMTVLSVAPGLLMVMTCFTRFVIVFSILRSALGLNQTPPEHGSDEHGAVHDLLRDAAGFRGCLGGRTASRS